MISSSTASPAHRTPAARPSIEALEARIALASVFVTYSDVDGDIVKVTASKPGPGAPSLDPSDFHFLNGGSQLAQLDLTAPDFQGAKIVFSVTKAPGGDGVAHVGYIDATGRDLAQVVVQGDLGRIKAGDAKSNGTPGLGLLSASSVGEYGLATQNAGGDLSSAIVGKLGALKVAGDFHGTLRVVGDIGSVALGGDLAGGAADDSGVISAARIGTVKIGGNLAGGSGEDSGQLLGASIRAVTIGGSLLGGEGEESGQLAAYDGKLGPVKIGGDVRGGRGTESGSIDGSSLQGVSIGGSLIGGPRSGSGGVTSGGDLGFVKIAGDLQGGSIRGFSVDRSGFIEAQQIGKITIGGSLLAGRDETAQGILTHSGAILARDSIGSIAIKGSIVGNEVAGYSFATISARGQAEPTATRDLALGSLSVGGDVIFARIDLGLSPDGDRQNADAQLGSVRVRGDWASSNLLVGAKVGLDSRAGTSDDVKLSGVGANFFTDTALRSRIGSVLIGGEVRGSLDFAGSHVGFVAEQIGSFKALGFRAQLTAGKDAPIIVPSSVGVVTIREI